MSPFGIPGRPSMIARRTSSRVGRTSARLAASVFGEGLPAVSEWQAAQFCSHANAAPEPPDPPPPQAGTTASDTARTETGATLIPRAYPSNAMDAADKRLCDLIQNEFPVVERPYAAIGERLEMGEDEVLERVQRLRGERIIRQISAIFDTRKLGYRSMLVAARAPAERADEAAEVISTHPGVTHNYERKHEFNIWFTLGVPPTSRLGLDRSVELLGELAGVEVIRPLPALRFFKIGVDLDMKGGRDPAAKKHRPAPTLEAPPPDAIGERDIAAIRALQTDLRAVAEPF